MNCWPQSSQQLLLVYHLLKVQAAACNSCMNYCGQCVTALRNGLKWYQAKIVQKLGINVYDVHVPELDVIWKRHCNQLSYIPNIVDAPAPQGLSDLIVEQQPPSLPRQGNRVRRPVLRYGLDIDVDVE